MDFAFFLFLLPRLNQKSPFSLRNQKNLIINIPDRTNKIWLFVFKQSSKLQHQLHISRCLFVARLKCMI